MVLIPSIYDRKGNERRVEIWVYVLFTGQKTDSGVNIRWFFTELLFIILMKYPQKEKFDVIHLVQPYWFLGQEMLHTLFIYKKVVYKKLLLDRPKPSKNLRKF